MRINNRRNDAKEWKNSRPRIIIHNYGGICVEVREVKRTKRKLRELGREKVT